MSAPLLLVEDTPSLSLVYKAVLNKAGYEVDCAFNCADTHKMFRADTHKIVLLDLALPDGDGSELMRGILASAPDTKVIVITANGSINRAVEAMRAGAFDFLVKPFDEARVTSAVRNATTSVASGSPPSRPDIDSGAFQGFIGSSDEMRSIYDMVSSIGRSSATVFITGDSGTGKEVCAQAIHTVSARENGPFVPLNCGAIPRDLLESEVFGHLKGSFTGAIADKLGAAETANGGTLFLDEICEMDLSLQTKLLRFLQTSTIQPVGATTQRFVDVRIVCATNRDPIEEVRAGRFREDLFYRLHVVPIHLPRLAERGNDVNEIAHFFLRKYAKEEGKSFRNISADVQQIFREFSWPGNVRQLLNSLRNIVVLNDAETVTPQMLPFDLRRMLAENPPQPTALDVTPRVADPGTPPIKTAQGAPSLAPFLGMTLAELERQFIEETISHYNGSVPKAAHHLDVSASTIYRKRETWANADRENSTE